MATSVKKIFKTTTSPNKWPAAFQSKFLLQLAELMQEGFPLCDCLQFMQITTPQKAEDFRTLIAELEQGVPLADAIVVFGFDSRTLTQLQLADEHGNLIETLANTSDYIERIEKQRKSFQRVTAYPLFLIIMAVGMLFVVRKFMLPTLAALGDTTNRAATLMIWFLECLPQLSLAGLGATLIAGLISMNYWKKADVFKRAELLVNIPGLSNLAKLYYSFNFALGMSIFLKNGFSVTQTVEELQSQKYDPLFAEIAERMEKSLLAGNTLPDFLADIPLFKEELSWITHHGEVTSQSAQKLYLYANSCFKELINRIEKIIKWIQPVLFLVVGLVVVLIYLVLMLPMLNLMKGV